MQKRHHYVVCVTEIERQRDKDRENVYVNAIPMEAGRGHWISWIFQVAVSGWTWILVAKL